MEKFILVGSKSCMNCNIVKSILDKKCEPYKWVDIGDYRGTLSIEGQEVVNKWNLKVAPDGTYVIPYLIRIEDGKVRNGAGAVSFAQKG